MSRIPFVAAVVGALLIGGATTGGTFASWKVAATQTGDSVTAGRIGFTHSESKTSFSLNKGTPAVTDTLEVTVTDQSLGKNMVQRIRPTITWGTGVSSAVAKKKISGSCSLTDQGDENLSPNGTFTMCVTATVDSTTSLTSSTVTVTLASQQMRGAIASGWSAPTQSYTIPVAISQPVASAAPTLVCGTAASSASFSWAAVTGATSYSIWQSVTNASDASYVSLGNGTSPYSPSITADGTTYWRAKSVNASGPSVFSNTLKIVRTTNNGGQPKYECTGATP
jgi:hypothetical protein